MKSSQGIHSRLDPDQVVSTIKTLLKRIEERFPDAALIETCQDLLDLSQAARSRANWISRPLYAIRAGALVLITVIVAGLIGTIAQLNITSRPFDLVVFVNFMDAGRNNVLLLAAAIYFLITVEARVKRRRLLVAIHELRSLAHVIDMHQLTKDPDRVLYNGTQTKSSPVVVMSIYEMSRYLDYCIEMLSLTGKIAATYGLFWRDDVSHQAVNDLERLTTGLSQKVFQKLMILHGNSV